MEKSLDMANEKIRELGELQMEGADTYMGTFAQLKTFPFFQQAAHWFYPFSTQISEVASILPSGNDKGNNLIRHLLELPMFCNSDRYSFCFTFMTIPQVQQNIVTSQLAEQDLHLNESIEQLVNENRKGEKPTSRPNSTCRIFTGSSSYGRSGKNSMISLPTTWPFGNASHWLRSTIRRRTSAIQPTSFSQKATGRKLPTCSGI